jgi:hypothetical protein
MMTTKTSLSEQARATLHANTRMGPSGPYTLPTDGLYPFQWNWDASVTALGWAHIDPERAFAELHTLFAGQWGPGDYGGANEGFLAQITFHTPSDSYFPGPDQWGTEALAVRTSSISQPPLHATMLRWIVDLMQKAPLVSVESSFLATHLRALLPKLVAHHRWWYRCRDPQGTGLVVNTHPWETGMDNSPAWDAPLVSVPETQRAYTRKDTGHVDASMRPPKAFYDRMVTLMDLNRMLGFDPQRILAESPYQVNDIGIISILQRATVDLAALCIEHGLSDEAREMQTYVDRTQQAVQSLWSPRWQQYVSRNALTGGLLDVPTSAGLLAAYAGFENDCADAVTKWLQETPFGLPSTRSTSPGFEPRRYWRGPVWQHINMLIARGLQDAGHGELAEQLRTRSERLFVDSGFHEYYDPLTGDGLGGSQFSWTAATYLHWLAPRTRSL